MRAAGANNSFLYSFAGAGHVPWGDLAAEPAAQALLGFLSEYLDLSHAQCPTPNASAHRG